MIHLYKSSFPFQKICDAGNKTYSLMHARQVISLRYTLRLSKIDSDQCKFIILQKMSKIRQKEKKTEE